ncbi:hypothetical protein NMB32_18605 [Stenotrophomonas sp. CD2]|nr:hypothetical protein NMB32_18605 [Stenotrophomonas sp. CD2]
MSRRKLFESPEPSSQMLGVGPAYVSVEGLRQHRPSSCCMRAGRW